MPASTRSSVKLDRAGWASSTRQRISSSSWFRRPQIPPTAPHRLGGASRGDSCIASPGGRARPTRTFASSMNSDESEAQPRILAMEYVEGETLARQDQGGTDQDRGGARICRQIAAGLGEPTARASSTGTSRAPTSWSRRKPGHGHLDFGLASFGRELADQEPDDSRDGGLHVPPNKPAGPNWTSGRTSGRWGLFSTRCSPEDCLFEGSRQS